MIQITSEPWRGQHPAFPERPDALPNSNPLQTSTTFGVLSGTLAYTWNRFTRRSAAASLLQSTARWTIIWLGATSVANVVHARVFVHPILEKDGIKPKRRIIEFTSNIGIDDFLIGGAVVGALLACHPRFAPAIRGPSRYIGSASWCAVIGHVGIWPALYRKEIEDGFRTWEEKRRHAQGQFITSGSYFETGAFSLSASPVESSTDEAVEDMQRQAELPPPGTAPHAIALVDGQQQWWPNTDYRWSPGDDGVPYLEAHMKELYQQRAEFAEEAEFVWLELAKKENIFLREKNQEIKYMQLKELELLCDIHSQLWKEVSSCDWMIANTKKKIRQLQALKTNSEWLPKPQTIDETYEPLKTLKRVKRHLENTKALVHTLEGGLLPPDTPDDVLHGYEHQLDEMQKNLQATVSLAKHLEKRIQEARSRQLSSRLGGGTLVESTHEPTSIQENNRSKK